MRAVVLVGGFGTRLRPLTLTVPKPMLPVGHVPIIERLVDNLAAGGVTDVTLALGFKPEPFRDAFPDGRCGHVVLRYAVEPEPLDTAGAIRFAADAAGIDETFVVANGDVITDLDIAAMVAAHRRTGAEGTIHVIPVEDPSAFGVLAVDGTGRVERFVEKPPPGTEPSTLINAGTYVLEPSVLERVGLGQRMSIERVVFPAVAATGRLYAHATDDYWIDTGTPELYLRANLDLLDGLRPVRCDAVAPGARVDPTADVGGSLVGPGAEVGPGARVERAVVLPGGSVGAGALVRRSIVMGTVGAGAEVDGCVIGADGSVGEHERVHGLRRPEHER